MSKFIKGTNRNQLPLFASSNDVATAQDNEIRLVDLFVDSRRLPDFGFTFDFVENEDSPTILRIYSKYLFTATAIVCSSRTLENECGRNIELMCRIFNLNYQKILKQYLKVLAPF